MGPFTKADVVVFPFPFSDLTNRKLRPCLVLSDEMGEDVLLCQITSTKVLRDEYSVELKRSETRDGSLMIDSYIRSNMLFTAAKSQIQRKICTVPAKKYKQIVGTILKLIS